MFVISIHLIASSLEIGGLARSCIEPAVDNHMSTVVVRRVCPDTLVRHVHILHLHPLFRTCKFSLWSSIFDT